MTGEVKSAPQDETVKQPQADSDAKPDDTPDTKPEIGANDTNDASDANDVRDASDTKAVTSDEAPAKPETSVFGGWGFDVNAVTGNINIGGLFAAPDAVEPGSDAEVGENGDEISAAASNIANVASTEIEHASKAAQETFGKAAEEIGKGWGTLNSFLDDMLTPKVDGEEETDDKDMTARFHSLFPELDEEDQVVDHFKCALLQKYRCYLNNATPEKAYPLRGRLFISTTHVAMYVTDDGGAFGKQPFGFTVAFADVGKIQKGAKAMLKLVTKSQQSYIFGDFESDSHFNGALSLLEHMKASGAAPPQPPPAKEVEGNTEEPAAG